MDIEQYIQDQVEQIDISAIVRQEVRANITDDIRKQIHAVVNREIEAIIKKEITFAMSQPISTDDGWGKKEAYPSIEALFKEKFASKLESSWEMKKTISREVQNKVNDLFNKSVHDVIAKITEELAKV